MRWWNTLLGAWVVVATFALPHHSGATEWNNVIVGALVLVISVVPSEALPEHRPASARTP